MPASHASNNLQRQGSSGSNAHAQAPDNESSGGGVVLFDEWELSRFRSNASWNPRSGNWDSCGSSLSRASHSSNGSSKSLEKRLRESVAEDDDGNVSETYSHDSEEPREVHEKFVIQEDYFSGGCQRSGSSSSIGSSNAVESSCYSSAAPEPSPAHQLNDIASSFRRKRTDHKSKEVRLDASCFVTRDQWVPHNARKHCNVCVRDFNLLRKKHSCRMCGEVVCSRCSVFKTVDLLVGETAKLRICSCCFFSYRNNNNNNNNKCTSDKSKSKQLDELAATSATSSFGSLLSSSTSASSLMSSAAVSSMPNDLSSQEDIDISSFQHPHNTSISSPTSRHLLPQCSSSSSSSSSRCLMEKRSSSDLSSLSTCSESSLGSSPPSSSQANAAGKHSIDSNASGSSSSSSSSSSSVNGSGGIVGSPRARAASGIVLLEENLNLWHAEEQEAVEKARHLEKEVENSKQRIEELEQIIREQELKNQQQELSLDQQSELEEAQKKIQRLQDQLRRKEEEIKIKVKAAVVARQRMSCSYTSVQQAMEETNQHSSSSSSESKDAEMLKQKLKLLERQLQQAGINVAELIPYEIAKAKVEEISKRLQQIGGSEAEDAALRREYFQLEQEMEKYHTALVMTDEYIAQEKAKELEWEEVNESINVACLRLVRQAIPVNLSVLSERDLANMTTPSGRPFPKELAKRLKRTNVLQLLRVDPSTISRMHPSVIESLRTSGLCLMERRALHMVLREPFEEWNKHKQEELSNRKYTWYKKLKEALVQSCSKRERHGLEPDEITEEMPPHASHVQSCAVGMACPFRVELKTEQLYATSGLGFSSEEEYFVQEIIKSDPEKAGEKALQEAQAHAKELKLNQRHRDLKAHYRMNIRGASLALGAMEEMEALLEKLQAVEQSFVNGFVYLDRVPCRNAQAMVQSLTSQLDIAREMLILIAKRAGICLVGKRDPSRDEVDDRSVVEAKLAADCVAYANALLSDLSNFCQQEATLSNPAHLSRLNANLGSLEELVQDILGKNTAIFHQAQVVHESTLQQRALWQELSTRPSPTAATAAASAKNDANGALMAGEGATSDPNPASAVRPSPPPPPPPSAMLFDAIRNRRKLKEANAEASTQDQSTLSSNASSSSSESRAASPPPPLPARRVNPNDLLAMIRARKNKAAEAEQAQPAKETTAPSHQLATDPDPPAPAPAPTQACAPTATEVVASTIVA